MASISYQKAKYQGDSPHGVYTFELRPPLTDRLAELVCNHETSVHAHVISNRNSGTRLSVECLTSGQDIEPVAQHIGKLAYGVDQAAGAVDIINLDRRS